MNEKVLTRQEGREIWNAALSAVSMHLDRIQWEGETRPDAIEGASREAQLIREVTRLETANHELVHKLIDTRKDLGSELDHARACMDEICKRCNRYF